MTLTATQPTPALLLAEPAADEARRQAGSLLLDLRHGTWKPTPLERRIARILTLSASAADGALSPRHIHNALWEGSLTMTRENGGRFATALGHLAPALGTPGVADMAVDLIGAVADQG
ncbi:hypothetical protein AMK16_30860 [Streptomyces sp. CB00455]|uniref:hypothetical protein n=1 Tax=Streptomyces sp. CB00455 TaxID=1703927 RepID=UPI00093D8B04|nr:hypothetical protein [Streptomyces sp. CB00455]OKK14252.1 hypothetical protein AMK16_30860 [Streptomyces sp. CB00455]